MTQRQATSKSLSAVEWRGDELGITLLKSLSSKRSVAIIGSRRPDQIGLYWASLIARAASENNILVVSGGARGVDECAHTKAKETGGESLAVLGCGLNHISQRHKRLANQGVGLITPFAHQMSARRWSFPRRNEYIARLADDIVVIQATTQSGSLSTARAALRYNKPVWVLTHLPTQSLHHGCLQLLGEGALPLMNSASWINERPQVPFDSVQEQTSCNAHQKLPQHASPLWQASCSTPRSLEQLALDAQLSFSEALSEATLLELQGWLTPSLGGLYQRAYGHSCRTI